MSAALQDAEVRVGLRVRVGVGVRVRVTVRVRVGVGSRVRVMVGVGVIHTLVSIVGLARKPYSVIVNHTSGRILIRSSISSHSLGYVAVHIQAALPFLVETETVLPLTLTKHN